MILVVCNLNFNTCILPMGMRKWQSQAMLYMQHDLGVGFCLFRGLFGTPRRYGSILLCLNNCYKIWHVPLSAKHFISTETELLI